MKIKILLLALISVSINSFQPPIITIPADVRIKPSAVRTLFPDSTLEKGTEVPTAIQPKRKISESESSSSSIDPLFDYLYEQLPEKDAEALIDILLRPKTIHLRSQTSFEDLYWMSNDGHDLRTLATDVIALLNKRIYTKLKRDTEFITQLAIFLSERYSGITLLRAIIPFASLPATTQFITGLFNRVPNLENVWCKELKILEKWLDTAQAPTVKDPFYENGILLLINALPKNHPLLTKDDSCIKDLLFHAVSGNYENIFNALIKKGANVNWKNAQDETPLLKAAFRANESMVQKLLNAGAQVNVPTIFSQTALDFAKLSPYANKDTIIRILTDKGAQSGESL